MKTQIELIEYYQKQLEKVKSCYNENNFKEKRYIVFAKWQLRAVKNGRKW